MAARKIYFNIQTGELVQSDTSPSVITANPIVLFLGDTVGLEFYPQEPTGDPSDPWTPMTIPGGATFKLGVKKASDYAAATYYAFQSTFTAVTNGKACTLSLNTAALLAELATTEASDDFIFELEMVSGGEATTLVQWTQTIKNQVNIGSEGSVTLGSPTYPTVTEMQAYVRGGNNSSQFFKRVPLVAGQRSYVVTFDTTLSSTTGYNAEFSFENLTDSDPDYFSAPNVTGKSATTMGFRLNAEPFVSNGVAVVKGNLDPA